MTTGITLASPPGVSPASTYEHAARGGLDGAPFPWGHDREPSGEHLMNVWQGTFPSDNTREDDVSSGELGLRWDFASNFNVTLQLDHTRLGDRSHASLAQVQATAQELSPV